MEDGPAKKRKRQKVTHRREKGAFTWEKAVILSSKRNKTTKKNSWVNKDLTKSSKWKCFEENSAVQNAIKNRTTKNWVEEDLSKFPMKKRKTLERQSKCHVFVKQVWFFFFTVNHRGPLPLRELHSTDETLVWRDPGGSWACLRPVYHYGWNYPVRVAVTCHLHRNWWHAFSEDKAALYTES